MESVYVGWWSVLPPLIAIILALLTKEVIVSLTVGVLSGTVIYAAATGGNLIVGPVETAFSLMTSSADIHLLLLLALLGTLVIVITKSGGSRVGGEYMASKLKTRHGTLLATTLLGFIVFLSDTFSSLTVSTVMKPVTDKNRVSRAKLAYILDATAAPICILAPVSTWAPGVIACIPENEYFYGIQAYIKQIPYNYYALLTVIMLLALAVLNLEYGPMAKVEQLAAETGDVGKIDSAVEDEVTISDKGRLIDMVLPVVVLIGVSILAMLQTGGYWSHNRTIAEAFAECASSQSMETGCFFGLLTAFLLYVPRGLMTFKEFMRSFVEGVKSMADAYIILLLAWGLGGVCRNLLQTGPFVSNVIVESNIPVGLLPAIIFFVAAALSFATGTSWGTFGIMTPLVFSICEAAAPSLLVISFSAVLGGSVFGDHCSPISDTTIIASAAAGCDHLLHNKTQIPYAFTVAAVCIVGYLVGGFTGGNSVIPLAVSVALMIAVLFVLHKKFGKKREGIKASSGEVTAGEATAAQ